MKSTSCNSAKALPAAVSGLFLAAVSGFANSTNVDKSGYTLFDPTPREAMREFSTDRPDKTESPYTVDAGHVQVELDLVNYTHYRNSSAGPTVEVDAWAVAPVNFKVGLLNWLDLQTVIESYHHVTTTVGGSGGGTLRQSGFGDITSRVKANFWGNDGGATALAIMPFVKFPTSQEDLGNHSVEGGLIVPFAWELPAGFGLGMMTEFDFNRNEIGAGYHTEYINSITVSHRLVGELDGYIEFFSAVIGERDFGWIGTVDVGFTYGLSENVQLDAGVNVGVTSSADGVNPFVGLSFRF